MKPLLLERLRAAVGEWSQNNNVEPALIDAKYTGLGASVHVLLVARRGFENWSAYERHKSLFGFLHQRVNDDGGLFIIRLSMMTEAEYEKYEGVAV